MKGGITAAHEQLQMWLCWNGIMKLRGVEAADYEMLQNMNWKRP